MIQLLIVLAGFIAGMLILVKQELKPGLKYYKALSDVLLALLITLFLREYIHLFSAVTAGAAMLIIQSKIQKPYLGILAIPIILLQNNDIITSIAFLYSIPTGTIVRGKW